MKALTPFISFLLCCLTTTAQYPVTQKAYEIGYSSGLANTNHHFTFKMVADCGEGILQIGYLYTHDLTYNTIERHEWVYDSSSNSISVADPCIAFPLAPCYRIVYYHTDCDLPYNNGGYSAFYIDCCRGYYQNFSTTFNASTVDFYSLSLPDMPGQVVFIGGIEKPSLGYVANSMASVINIPSKFKVSANSSPVFTSSTDTILYVCRNTGFEHIFNATDADGDSLAYSFATPHTFYVAGGPPGRYHIDTTGNSIPVSYLLPYSVAEPLGPDVTLDAKTGLLKGKLFDTGSYLVTIGVNEYRKGQLLTRSPYTKDVVVKVFDCSKLQVPKAILPPLINTCDSNIVTLPNNTTPYHPELFWDNNKYLWNLGDGGTSQVRYPVHTYDTGTYNVRLITMAGYRCADTAYTKLLVYPSVHPSFNISGNDCTGQPIKFINTSTTDIGGINNLTWKFINLKDSSSFISRLNNPTYVFNVPNQTYSAVLNVTTTKGCEAADTQYLNIQQSPPPLQTHDTIITTGAPYQLYANSGYDTMGSRYTWTPSTGLDNPFSANPTATGTQDITYRVQASNSFGCSLTDTVHLIYYKGPDIYLPAAFTPNGDGKNDIFRPFPVGIQKLEYFRVFDRWGNNVYQTQAYLAGWDGNIGGKPAPAGTYIYEARGKDYNNKTVFKKGSVLLLR